MKYYLWILFHILRTTPRQLNQIRPLRSTTAKPGPASLTRTPLNRSSVRSVPRRNRPSASPRRRTSKRRPRWVPPNSRALWSVEWSAAGRCWTSPRPSPRSWCATSVKPWRSWRRGKTGVMSSLPTANILSTGWGSCPRTHCHISCTRWKTVSSNTQWTRACHYKIPPASSPT